MAEKSGNNGSAEVLSKDQIRAKIFSKQNFATKRVDFFGTEVELRQPSLEDVLELQASPDTKDAIINALIKYTYVPGTSDPVFNNADKPHLLKLPFGKEFSALNDAIAELTNIDILGEEKNSVSTPSGETS